MKVFVKSLNFWTTNWCFGIVCRKIKKTCLWPHTCMNCYLPRDTIYQELCHHQNDIFLLFSCNLIFSRFLQFLWFMNPFIKWCWEGRGRRKPLLQYSLLCMKCIKALFLAFLPMALGRSASQFIFKIYVSWCSFALFSCVFETKNKGNSSSFVMQPFLQLINHHSSAQDQLSSCF